MSLDGQKTFHIWSEGFASSGFDKQPATYHGEWPGETFIDAIEAYMASDADAASHVKLKGGLLDSKTFQLLDVPTYWGCKLFDNEKDARAAFG